MPNAKVRKKMNKLKEYRDQIMSNIKQLYASIIIPHKDVVMAKNVNLHMAPRN